MKYYIILVSVLSTLILSVSTLALTRVVNTQQEQVQYITELETQYWTTRQERDQAGAGLVEIQNRINAVREALR